MIERQLDEITADDIRALLAAKRVEDRRLEYKSKLPGGSDRDKREFLADVAAFANGSGGDILYGIEESAGVPVATPGVSLADFDAERARLQNMIREAIRPRIPSVEIRAIGEFDTGPVLLVRVRQSWVSPHMVTFSGDSRFYLRDAGQRHVMDVQELRAAFVGSETLGEKLRAFRDERLARVLAASTPVPLEPNPIVVLHLVPVGSDFLRSDIDPRLVGDHWLKLLSSQFVEAANTRINLEGFLLYSSPTVSNTQQTNSYIQLYRNGAVEAVTTLRPTNGERIELVGRRFEQHVISVIEALRTFRRDIGTGGDLLIFLSLLRCDSVILYAGEPYRSTGRALGRELIVLPDVLVDDIGPAVGRLLRQAFDTMWQAAGFVGSPSYNDGGEWLAPAG